jgi:hypothetical protein
MVSNVRYFSCKENYGTFVLREKIQQIIPKRTYMAAPVIGISPMSPRPNYDSRRASTPGNMNVFRFPDLPGKSSSTPLKSQGLTSSLQQDTGAPSTGTVAPLSSMAELRKSLNMILQGGKPVSPLVCSLSLINMSFCSGSFFFNDFFLLLFF